MRLFRKFSTSLSSLHCHRENNHFSTFLFLQLILKTTKIKFAPWTQQQSAGRGCDTQKKTQINSALFCKNKCYLTHDGSCSPLNTTWADDKHTHLLPDGMEPSAPSLHKKFMAGAEKLPWTRQPHPNTSQLHARALHSLTQKG